MKTQFWHQQETPYWLDLTLPAFISKTKFDPACNRDGCLLETRCLFIDGQQGLYIYINVHTHTYL